MGALAERRIQDEIASFIGTDNVLQNLSDSISSLNSIPEFENKYSSEKFHLMNGLFAFFPNYFRLPKDDDFNGVGAKVLSIDFCNQKNAAQTINQYVDAGTKGRIKQIVSPNEISRSSSLFLLHTIYVNASWSLSFVTSPLDFAIGDTSMRVKSFYNSDSNLRILIQNQTIFLEIPTINGSFLLRYNKDSVAPISSEEIDSFKNDAQIKRIKSLQLPNIKFTETYELDKLLASDLPEVLTKSFNLKKTILGPTDAGVLVSKWTQKIVFEMSNTGIDAASVSYMGVVCGCGPLKEKEEEKPINVIVCSPFSFAYFVHSNEPDSGHNLIFSGLINSHFPLERDTGRR
ncbi:MAG: hypothetical protein NEHIOOID_00639 [Holosporales bacterium]